MENGVSRPPCTLKPLKTLTDLKNLETLKLFPTNLSFFPAMARIYVQNARLGNVFCSLKTFVKYSPNTVVGQYLNT